MGYIDKKFGIKSAKSLEKYIKTITAKEVMVIKMANSLRLIWALGDDLHTYDIEAHVIYIVEEEELHKATDFILVSLNDHAIKIMGDGRTN
jgi:hypothetical protein